MEEDPEPACPPPAWACEIVEACKASLGLEVYPPSDDTFLLLETLAAEQSLWRPWPLCLEVGSGSGAVSAGLGRLLKAWQMAVDKNPEATRCSAEVLRLHRVLADVIRGSFTDCFRAGTVDLLICNPPYVPTDEEEMQGCGISISWAGGRRGREIIDILLPKAAELLSVGGYFYLVAIKENEPEEVLLNGHKLGLLGETARREQRGMEELFILRFQKPCEMEARKASRSGAI